MLTTIPPFQVVSHVMKKPPSFCLRGRRLKGKGKGVLCARETRGAGEEGERETAFPSLPPSSRAPRAPNPLSLPFQTPATQATKFGRKKLTLRQRKNTLTPVPARFFLRLCITWYNVAYMEYLPVCYFQDGAFWYFCWCKGQTCLGDWRRSKARVIYSIDLKNTYNKWEMFFSSLKDTCTGFLLGGIGEINAKRQKNFLVVTKGKLSLNSKTFLNLIS